MTSGKSRITWKPRYKCHLLAGVLSILPVVTPAIAQVGTLNASNLQDLISAFNTINSNPTTGYTINLSQNIALSSSNPLPTITSNAVDTINANGFSLTGDGGISKSGFGTLLLTGTNTYAGPSTVNSGALSVNGSIASSPVTVSSGATLRGTGTVGSAMIASGGTLAPGSPNSSIGTISVSGNLTLASGSTYSVDVSLSAADRVNVTGTASIAGGLLFPFTPGGLPGSRYTLLNASGGLTGTFSSIFAFGGFRDDVHPRFIYDGNSFTLVDDPNAITPLIPAGSGSNAFAVAGVIDMVLRGGGVAPEAYALYNLPVSSLPDMLERFAGENQGAVVQESNQSQRLFLDLILDPSAGTRAERQTMSSQSGVWGAIYGGHLRMPGSAVTGSHSESDNGGGLAIGFDYAAAPGWMVGTSVSIGRSDFRVNQSFGSGHADEYQFALYGSADYGDLYVSTAGVYSIFDVRSSRAVTINAMTDAYAAAYTAHGFGGKAEAGVRDILPLPGVTPFAAVLAQSIQMPQYVERTVSGSSLLEIHATSHSYDRLRSELGLDFSPPSGFEPGLIHLRAGWAHEFMRTNSTTESFWTLPEGATGPDESFTITGAKLLDSGFVAAGVQLPIATNLTLSGSAEDDFGTTSSYGGSAELRMTW